MRRTGGSRSSPRGGDRRLAPRGLGSGRRSCADAEARRHGTLRLTRRGAPVSQPAPGRVFRDRARRDARLRRGGSRVGVRGRPRQRIPGEPRLGRRVHDRAPVHAHVPHTSRGQVERRRADHRRRLRLHPPGARVPRTERSAQPVHATDGRARAPRHGRRPEDGRGRSSLPLRRLARAVPERAAPTCARGQRPRDGLERSHRQPEDGSADRKRTISRRALGARAEAHASPKPQLLRTPSRLPRTARGSLHRSSAGACRRREKRSGGLRGRARRPRRGPRASEGGRAQGPGNAATAAPSTSRSGSAPEGTLPSGTSSSAGRSPTGSTASRSSASSTATSTRSCACSTTCSSATQSAHYAPNWRRYRYRPALARRLLEQAGCRRGSGGVYECDGRPLLLRFVTSAGIPPRARVLSLVQAQLRQVGIAVEQRFASRQVLFGQIIQPGDFDVGPLQLDLLP